MKILSYSFLFICFLTHSIHSLCQNNFPSSGQVYIGGAPSPAYNSLLNIKTTLNWKPGIYLESNNTGPWGKSLSIKTTMTETYGIHMSHGNDKILRVGGYGTETWKSLKITGDNQSFRIINNNTDYQVSLGTSSSGFYLKMSSNGFLSHTIPFFISTSGNVQVGTSTDRGYKFAVDGTVGVKGRISAQEVEVIPSVWADYVFNPEYQLKPLSEVELYIAENGHLPDVKSTEEVTGEGLNLGEMDATLLQKVEELTLYLIEQNKRIEALENELKTANQTKALKN